ncbi:MAG: hypothetical protein IKO31_04635 [Bacteroidales bacterium]|nr:hypothetical protein [Bacteroidales bacterium]MBR4595987.1 hypothetical protein [Bacteroidales bacterium]
MKKQTYLEPAVQVLSLAPMQETLQGGSEVDLLMIGGTNLDAPSDLSGEVYTDIFTTL